LEPEVLYEKSGKWVTVGIQSHISWPTEVSIYHFRDYDLLLRPGDNTIYTTISLKYDNYGIDENTARKTIMHFVSSLAWYEDSPIYIKAWSGGSRCFNLGRPGIGNESAKPVTPLFPVKTLGVRELPDTLDKNARAALAFYREGLELDNISYKFLSFYKIINLFVGQNGPSHKQEKFINKNLSFLKPGSDAQKRMEELQNTCSDIGKYLYVSCRCAVAHADADMDNFVDPEDINELTRLNADLPLVRALSQIVIEKEYGIKSRQTIYKEHLYELRGFRKIFGDEILRRVVNDEKIGTIEIPALPNLNLRVAHNHKFVDSMVISVFEGLQPKVIEVAKGIIYLECRKMHLASVFMGFDFKNERILFNPCNCFSLKDDLSPTPAQYAIDFYEFLKVYFCNGILELWNTDTGELLGYTDPFLPYNMDPTRTLAGFDSNIAFWKAELEKRLTENKGYEKK
jgi:hypothetical protein